ncbi:MFS general substrate transporter [Thozetella sp. PMI_491]|nr:MFS general substrate transporter [Thozetella sp. PMI_491]
MFFFTKAREIVWGKPAATKEERRLVMKLDAMILTFVCLMYWVNYLDRSNLNNAYVSGLKEDLGMYGTELNQINSVFYVGYTLGQIPNNIALQKIPPHLYFATAITIWGFFTLGTAFVTTWQQVMALRFCEGLFESATFVGTHYVLGSWYNAEELGKRTAVFAASGVIGNMFSGILQGAIYTNLSGLHGLKGWRWLFIIDFLITIPVAIFGFFIFPGHPETMRTNLLTDSEKRLAIERIPEPTIKRGKLDWALAKRVVTSWEFYLLPLLALLGGDTEMYADNSILALWLKSLGTYTVQQINYMPTAVYALAAVSILVCSWYADYFRNRNGRVHVGIFLSITAIISGAIMLKPPNHGAKFFALYLNGIELGYRAVTFAWANEIMRMDDGKRAIVIGMMNAMTIAFYIFWTLLFYNTTQGPDWYMGNIAMICTGVAMIFSALAVRFMERRSKLQADVIEAEAEASSDIVKPYQATKVTSKDLP